MEILKWCSVLMKSVHCEQAFTKSENNKTELMIRPVMNSQKQQCALCAAHWLSRYHIGLVEAGQPPKQHSVQFTYFILRQREWAVNAWLSIKSSKQSPWKIVKTLGLCFAVCGEQNMCLIKISFSCDWLWLRGLKLGTPSLHCAALQFFNKCPYNP